MSTVVLCQYFIQNEETKIKARKRIYNAFVLPKKYNSIKEVRVADIKHHFPFNSEEYHFRFQTKMGNMKLWVDTSKDTVAVPNIDGVIKIKILKFPKGVVAKPPKPMPTSQSQKASESEPVPKHETHEDHVGNLSPGKHKHIPHSNSQNNIAKEPEDLRQDNNHKPMSYDGHDEDLFGNGDHNGDHKNHEHMDFNINSDDIFGNDGSSHPPHHPHTPQEEHNDGNLLGDFDTVHNTKEEKPKTQDNDFNLAGDLHGLDLNFDPEEQKRKEEAKKPKETLSDHFNNINEADETHKREWQLAYQKYENRIKMWKGTQVQNSIKVLLCTLHDVLWEGANWKRIGMHELADGNSVKKAYRKAILITHPDRHNKAPTEQKFLANRIFGGLNEAWKVFENSGQ